MYILLCSGNTYYPGSTIDLERRIEQHQAGEGAKYTCKRLPVELVYFEEFMRIDEAFAREKQVQNWSHAKKQALIENKNEFLPDLANKRPGINVNPTHLRPMETAARIRVTARLKAERVKTAEQFS